MEVRQYNSWREDPNAEVAVFCVPSTQGNSHILRQFRPVDAEDDSWMDDATKAQTAFDEAGARLKRGLPENHFSSDNQRERANKKWKDQGLQTHLRNAAKMTVGLKNSSNGTNRKELEDRIEYVVVRFSEFDEVRSQRFDWFIKNQQMNEVRQQLGFARYVRREQHKISIDPKVVWRRFATEEAWQEFQEEGTVNISGLLDFLLQDEQVSQYINDTGLPQILGRKRVARAEQRPVSAVLAQT
jgi:hypothetical protein